MKITLQYCISLGLSGWMLAACGQANSDSDTQTASTEASMAFSTGTAASFRLENVAEQVTSPVNMAHAGDGSGRLFIVEQPGRIRIVKDGKLSQQPFLDITSRTVRLGENYSEMGLLGLAFHPDFKSNGRFFVYYSTPAKKGGGVDHQSILAEYKAAGNSGQAQMAEKVLLRVDQPESNHNGGHLAFGPDGYLYVGLGDGGGAGDKHGKIGNGQDLSNLLGKIIRLDVDKGQPYAIPADNPFVGKDGMDEIYAYGLRNPWRFSFDRQTGQLFCGDVGQNELEEVNIIEKGKNYGWRAMEASEVYDKSLKASAGPTVLPIDEYPHSLGNSITGGYVYRGKNIPALLGRYIYGDWSGKLFYLEEQGGKWQRHPLNLAGDGTMELRVNSFGEDENGELYILTQREVGPKSPSGIVYRLAAGAGNQ
jgi:glucose/arabinose dehydrogenase